MAPAIIESPAAEVSAVLADLRHDHASTIVSLAAPLSATECSAQARTLLEHGWAWGVHPMIPLTRLPIPWDLPERTSRAWAFHLHSWEFLGPLLADHRRHGTRRSLDAAIAAVADWVSYDARHPDDAFTWYDMAVGLRAALLAPLMSFALDAGSTAVLPTLISLAERHLAVLDDDDLFAGHSNHGLYQAAGSLVLSSQIPSLDPGGHFLTRATDRFTGLLDRQFSLAGVHREHSPGYHAMVLATLQGIADSFVGRQAPGIRLRLDRATQTLEWFLQPDGTLAPLGDTARGVRWPGPNAGASIHNAEPTSTPRVPGHVNVDVRTFAEDGYAILRGTADGPAGGTQESLAVLSASFHSRTHKHADDLSLLWWDRRQEILTDAGQFDYEGSRPSEGTDLAELGFWYSDPRRIFVESTHAHSTVEIDGVSQDRRRRRPFGSGIRASLSHRATHLLQGRVDHGSVVHQRVVILRPASWAVVVDRLYDTGAVIHDFRQRFVLAPGLDVDECEGTLRLTHPMWTQPLWVEQALSETRHEAPVRGQVLPRLEGWVAQTTQELEPTNTVSWSSRGPHATFAAVFRFGDDPPPPPNVECQLTRRGLRVTARLVGDDGPVVLRFTWHQDGVRRLAVSR